MYLCRANLYVLIKSYVPVHIIAGTEWKIKYGTWNTEYGMGQNHGNSRNPEYGKLSFCKDNSYKIRTNTDPALILYIKQISHST
jgi:hypothetical protein